MGAYLYANQYQNEVIPDEEKRFKPEWLKYYDHIPLNKFSFAFIDPAIGQKESNDYTGLAVIDADENGIWYCRQLVRLRLTPTEIVNLCFEVHRKYNCHTIGIEQVAYQEALLYLVDDEMKKRQTIVPVKGIKRSRQTKEMRILSLVPRFEWSRVLLQQGFHDFEDEYSSFPRAPHDDILDALASLEEIVIYPEPKKTDVIEKPHSPHHPDYERWYIRQLAKNQQKGDY